MENIYNISHRYPVIRASGVAYSSCWRQHLVVAGVWSSRVGLWQSFIQPSDTLSSLSSRMVAQLLSGPNCWKEHTLFNDSETLFVHWESWLVYDKGPFSISDLPTDRCNAFVGGWDITSPVPPSDTTPTATAAQFWRLTKVFFRDGNAQGRTRLPPQSGMWMPLVARDIRVLQSYEGRRPLISL